MPELARKDNHLARQIGNIYTELLKIPENSVDLQESLQSVISKAIHEPISDGLTTIEIPKTNSLALQLLDYASSHDLSRDALEDRLKRSLTGIVDIDHLKKINEDQSLPGSSPLAGNADIILHYQSLLAREDYPYDTLIIRGQGDEFAILVLPKTQADLDTSPIEASIQSRTTELIDDLSPDSPLSKIAKRNPLLISKTIKWLPTIDINVPTKEAGRMADISEVLMDSADRSTDPVSSKLSSKMMDLIATTITDLETATADGATTLLSAYTQTTNAESDQELDLQIIQKRINLVHKHCPPSLREHVNRLLNHATSSSQNNALVLTLVEEAIFNMQFSRKNTVLNEWVYNELVAEGDYQDLAMIGNTLTKYSNHETGRVATSQRLHQLVARFGTKAQDLGGIIKKSGASFYLAFPKGKMDEFEQFVNNHNKALFEKWQTQLQTSTPNWETNYELFGELMLASYTQADSPINSLEQLGTLQDNQRQLHYPSETMTALAFLQDLNPDNRLLRDLFFLMIAERPEPRTQDLFSYPGIPFNPNDPSVFNLPVPTDLVPSPHPWRS